MRRTAVALGAALLVTTLTGCGDVNKGSAFANEFQAFLDDRDNLESASATGSNPLPWSGTGDVTIQVVPGLSDDEIVDEVSAITRHEVENHVSYDLEVRFPAETDGGDPALASFHLGVPGPAPDDGALRDEIERRLELARDLVTLGEGETDVEASAMHTRFATQADALAVAASVCQQGDFEELLDSLTVVGSFPDGTDSQVSLNDSGDCYWLSDAAEIADAVGALGRIVSYQVSHQSYDSMPRLSITLDRETVVDLSGPEALASELGLELVVS